MLTELCEYLRNWFDYDCYKLFGEITIEGGTISALDSLAVTGQYYRIIGSVHNDGVHQYGEDVLINETFDGAVWLMKIPTAVINLANEIADWRASYDGATSQANGPFQSESFAGYSYSKAGGTTSADGTGFTTNTWQGAFAAKLSPWRKL